ncbi:acyl-CoA N-acyltransferase [Syncephalis pseudoplumigaleata]|uniref:Acyl-CoA N-acyltransferase n=1 Tax=Syncephalis pseudoplumigaleata TaxID=1712513 RepID=A0A4P9YUK6_9FUNG|nr:acyl-CoA N-acyltransferase [Syncephalis pseudoplumigaleata]|eukprot:RKP23647.1 acyl-CoA N-acyltransferase [Syncephalis pseudoplumigaleata]
MRGTIVPLNVADVHAAMPSVDVALVEIQRLERKTFPRSEHTWPGDCQPRLTTRQHVLIANNSTGKHTKKKGKVDRAATTQACLLAGYLTIQLDPARSQITKLAVSPTYRGKGIGTELVRQATMLSTTLGRQRCELHVDPERIAARRLYERCGFEEHGTVEDYYGTGRDAIALRWQASL